MRRERVLAFTVASCIASYAAGDRLWNALANPLVLAATLAWLFAAILVASLAVVRHAEALAERLGDPYGTLVLTLAVTAIEVTSISAMMLHGEENPTLARDTLFAVVMIILNGMVGASLLIGGWRHREQFHNLQGANAYLGAVIPLAVLGLVLPDFTQTTQGPTLSFVQQIFLVVVSVGLYGAFLLLQTGRLRDYFGARPEVALERARRLDGTAMRSAALLLAHLVPALLLARQMAFPIDYLIETLHAPASLGGVILAALVAAPEALGAMRAAFANQLQRSVNIFLGSILSTIGITIPAMILLSELFGQTIVLGVQHGDLVLLLLTLVVSIVTFSSGRTNVMQGLIHLILFMAYLLLIFQD